jgi:hypothetical protein
MNDYYMLNDVARILRAKPYRIIYLLTSGQVPDVMRLGGRRVFRFEDMVRIAEKLQIQIAQEVQNKDEGGENDRDR